MCRLCAAAAEDDDPFFSTAPKPRDASGSSSTPSPGGDLLDLDGFLDGTAAAAAVAQATPTATATAATATAATATAATATAAAATAVNQGANGAGSVFAGEDLWGGSSNKEEGEEQEGKASTALHAAKHVSTQEQQPQQQQQQPQQQQQRDVDLLAGFSFTPITGSDATAAAAKATAPSVAAFVDALPDLSFMLKHTQLSIVRR